MSLYLVINPPRNLSSKPKPTLLLLLHRLSRRFIHIHCTGSSFRHSNRRLLARPVGVIDVIPRHVQEQRLDRHRLDLRRVRNQVREIDLQAGCRVSVQVLHGRSGGSHVLLRRDGGV